MKPKTTFNVGRVGGGTSVNAIPFECWMEVDMRSADKASLETVNSKFKAPCRKRWRKKTSAGTVRGPVSANGTGGLSSPGSHPADSAIVITAIAVTKTIRIFRASGRRVHRFECPDEFGDSGHYHRRRRAGHWRACAG